jgi:hypothetical protein
MNLDPGTASCAIGEHSRNQFQSMSPQGMRDSIIPYCVNAGISQEDLKFTACSRVAKHRIIEVFLDSFKHDEKKYFC